MRRYAIPGLLLLAGVAAIAAPAIRYEAFGRSTPNLLFVGAALYVVGAAWWALSAAAGSLPLTWRLPLIWIPAVAPTAWLAAATVASRHDDVNALAMVELIGPVSIVCLACLFATVAALLFSLRSRGQPQ